jgi:hypothetical protein
MASPNFANAVIDGGPDFLEANCTRVDICTTEPTTYAEATSTYTVANYTLDGTDWTIADGDTSGRKITLGAQSGNNGTATGAGNFLAFTDGISVLYAVIDADGDTVNSGSAANITATKVWESADPT